jgi:hypothetical protein
LKNNSWSLTWQGQHYKLYGVEGSTLKKGELQLMKKVQEAQMNIQQTEARKICYQEASRFYIKQPGQKTSRYDANNTKEPRQHSK